MPKKPKSAKPILADHKKVGKKFIPPFVAQVGPIAAFNLGVMHATGRGVAQDDDQAVQAGVGLDQIRAFSRHRTLATMLIYRDEHDPMATQRQLADVVAATLTA